MEVSECKDKRKNEDRAASDEGGDRTEAKKQKTAPSTPPIRFIVRRVEALEDVVKEMRPPLNVHNAVLRLIAEYAGPEYDCECHQRGLHISHS